MLFYYYYYYNFEWKKLGLSKTLNFIATSVRNCLNNRIWINCLDMSYKTKFLNNLLNYINVVTITNYVIKICNVVWLPLHCSGYLSLIVLLFLILLITFSRWLTWKKVVVSLTRCNNTVSFTRRHFKFTWSSVLFSLLFHSYWFFWLINILY